MRIEKVAVIGAGVMGSGIGAHLANCGLDVLLPRPGPRRREGRGPLQPGDTRRRGAQESAAYAAEAYPF